MPNHQYGGAEHARPQESSTPWVPPYSVPPHPANEAFISTMQSLLVETVALHLAQIADGEDYQWAAMQIRDYFADQFGPEFAEPATPAVPRFLLPPTERMVEPRIDPTAFHRQVMALELPEPDTACAIVRNLQWLCDEFGLSQAEHQWLLWTVVVNSVHHLMVESILADIHFEDEAKAFAALSLLFGVPVSEIEQCFAVPCRLLAMRLTDSHHWHGPVALGSFFQGTENLTDLLHVVHYSRAGMVQRMSELSLYWSLLPTAGVFPDQFREWFEPAMANACIATIEGQPLSGDNIAQLIWWLTGSRIPSEQCAPLAGHVDFDTMQKAIQQCVMQRSRQHLPITDLNLLQALYAIAK